MKEPFRGQRGEFWDAHKQPASEFQEVEEGGGGPDRRPKEGGGEMIGRGVLDESGTALPAPFRDRSPKGLFCQQLGHNTTQVFEARDQGLK